MDEGLKEGVGGEAEESGKTKEKRDTTLEGEGGRSERGTDWQTNRLTD